MRTSRSNPWIMLACFAAGAVAAYLIFTHFNKKTDLPSAENSLGMKFVRLSAGKFVMGSPAEEEARWDDEYPHEVEITRPFFLGAHEVTQREFETVMGFNPAAVTKNAANHPVENVSWQEAVDFCRRLTALPGEKEARRSYRLPTEAEWEYACRAGTTTRFHTGNTLSPRQALVTGRGEPPNKTLPVGSFDPNPWGLYDMHGNADEWVQDWYDANYGKSGKADPQGPETGTKRVVRGGSRGDDDDLCRCASRTAVPPEVRLGIGFRVVMELDPKK